jgi:hypothetical protein
LLRSEEIIKMDNMRGTLSGRFKWQLLPAVTQFLATLRSPMSSACSSVHPRPWTPPHKNIKRRHLKGKKRPRDPEKIEKRRKERLLSPAEGATQSRFREMGRGETLFTLAPSVERLSFSKISRKFTISVRIKIIKRKKKKGKFSIERKIRLTSS